MKFIEPGSVRLLPGVRRPRRNSPAGIVDVQQSRNRADLSDLVDLMILIVINLFFMQWENARLPLVSRDVSLVALLATNAFYVWGWFRSRILPLWRTRRIVSTWCSEEKSRFYS
ncbi:MAG TPA: hypothetical protein VM534_02225 [Thermoanaerobaculia bacterium]|nr:hypothetical protein [Thermoanaerobaculia bacterium]